MGRHVTELCAYCGMKPGTEREHVIARSFFDVQPQQHFTVPSCTDCNQKRGDGGSTDLQLDETYMRTAFCMSRQVNESQAAQSVLQNKVFPYFDKNAKFLTSIVKT